MNKTIRVLSFAFAIISGALFSASAWADTCKVIAVDFNTSTYTIADDEDAGIIGLPEGAVVYGAGVNMTDGNSGTASGLTVYDAIGHEGTSSDASVTWAAGGNCYKWEKATTKMLKGYLDDDKTVKANAPGDSNLKICSTTKIDFTNIPFARYNVYVYMQCDTAQSSGGYTTSFASITINDFSHCKYTEDGSISSGAGYNYGWGVPQAKEPTLGGNVIWFKDQTGSTLNLKAERSQKGTSQTKYYRRAGIAAVVIVDTTPKETAWTGSGDGSTWADDANWNPAAPGQDYTVTFDGAGAETTYDLGSLTFSSLEVTSGNWKTTFGDTCFTATPITIASDASFALAWTGEPAANPFSTEAGEVTIAGTLDLGGATQAVTGVTDPTLFFIDGGKVMNHLMSRSTMPRG